ncbi:MAG: PHP domain-containing protein [Spirochaetaceae bacterium]|nr:PHP domain-containing protein [Spirochaetaceae bacterium]
MRIDLHVHSWASDGTDSPADVVRAAAEAGLDVVALTDHDTTSGWSDAVAALPGGLRLVRGAEISCAYDGVSLHLLAYLFDPAHEALGVEMGMALDDRVPRAKAIVAKLSAAGHPVTWELVQAQLSEGATVGRPHVADALVAAGVVPDRTAAFDTLLHDGSEFFVGHYYVDALEAIRLVRAAGGVPVFAHPAASTRGPVVADAAITAMAAAGLAGIEVDHRDNPPEARERLRGLARDLGLLVTGASDYHGAGKENRLGEHTTEPEVFEALVAQATGDTAVAASAPVR